MTTANKSSRGRGGGGCWRLELTDALVETLQNSLPRLGNIIDNLRLLTDEFKSNVSSLTNKKVKNTCEHSVFARNHFTTFMKLNLHQLVFRFHF